MATLTTAAKVQKALEQQNVTVPDTTLIERLIDEVGEDFGNYCNRKFLQASYLEYFDGGSTRYYNLLNFPAIGITKVEYYQTKTSGVEDWEELDQDDYRVDLAGGRIQYLGGFTVGFQNWRVTYTAGYNAAGAEAYLPPNDLEGAAIAEVVLRFTAFQTEPMPVPSGSRLEDLRGQILSATAKAILNNYRIPGLR